MRAINVCFDYEENELSTRVCFPEKVIELSHEQFKDFKSRPHDDFYFLDENAELMYESERGIYHGLLLMNKAGDDGIFVMSNPFKRDVSYVPYARYYLEKEQYPSLGEFTRKMLRKVGECVTKAVQDQESGAYQISLSDASGGTDNLPFDNDLFVNMLCNRDEIESAEIGFDDYDDTVFIGIAKEYLRQENDDELRPLTQKEVELMCAKHLLWLNNEGGEQADFSNCLLRGLNLTNKELENAIFDGSKLVNTEMCRVDASYGSFVGTRIANCEVYNCTMTEADFTKAEISNSQLSHCDMSSGNFTKAAMRNCNAYGINMRDSCLEKMSFRGTKKDDIDRTDCVESEKEWVAERNGENLDMGGMK